MQSKESRREVIRKYKEHRPLLGAYAVRCAATGNVWIGVTKNLEATRNRCWFGLRCGLFQDKSLQEEWNAHGESAFQYEILESLKENVHPVEIDDRLQQMKRGWITRLSARSLL